MNTSPQCQAEPSRLRTAVLIGANPEILAMLQDTLDPLDWRVQQASDNETALAIAADTRVDLVITDENTSARVDVAL